ncbi:DUF885 domain-containing protein [Ahniella affigens]|uniref:DUF885 domain-containing protein n=1 Tax=Ahniella affigens TaxID=2021234 RepID=A0A2P1PXQ6_9GAMM|nr:DUF885 domain-containing protein [Ahniella affigens]AVP99594.1 DUF885 domain-containing protein [Ahniella affigens]
MIRTTPIRLIWSAALCCASAFASASDADLQALYDKEWAWRMNEFPGMASYLALGGPAHTLGSVDAKAQQERLTYWRGVRDALDQLDQKDLSDLGRLNAAVYRSQLDEFIVGIESKSYLLPMNGDSSFYGDVEQGFVNDQISSTEQAQAYLDRLADVPRYFDEHVVLLKTGLKTGMTVQQIVLEGREQPLAKLAAAKPEDTPFYAPFKKLPNSWSADDQAKWRAKVAKVIADKVQPACERLRAFLKNEYIPKARQTLAAKDLPDGLAYYQAQIKIYTTLDATPDEIHQIGLDEVARIRAEMEQVKQDAKFDGDLAAFIQFLRTDPQFYPKTPKALLERASYIAKRIDGLLPRYFGHLPRQPYGVAPVPDSIAPFYTAGRYVPGSLQAKQSGTYWVNTFKLEARPLYALPALTLHEAVPGHHLQGAIAAEADDLPNFRRYSYISAYGEGWALYGEHLGKEMGIYEDAYEQFGRLTYEMWRACRLVVDTGLHAKGWTREQARQYLKDNTALSEHEIGTEVDRYIGWPGQALSYKLGEIEIRKLRAEAEQKLGTKFDLRAFHDHLLGLGSVPLPVLRSAMQEWMAKQAG